MEFETLSTERLILRKFTPEIISDIFENCPEEEVKRLLGTTSEEEFQVEKRKNEGGYTTYRSTMICFRMVDKLTNKIVGSCSLHNWMPDHFRAEIGYAMTLEEYKRKGLMTEAVNALIEYGFKVMKLVRIEAFTSPENIASRKILKKFNFQEEGLMHNHYFYDGKLQDSVVYALLVEEYEGQ